MKNIWHLTTEIPNCEDIIVFFSDGIKVGYYSEKDNEYCEFIRGVRGNVVYQDKFIPEMVERWAYFDDILDLEDIFKEAFATMKNCLGCIRDMHKSDKRVRSDILDMLTLFSIKLDGDKND